MNIILPILMTVCILPGFNKAISTEAQTKELTVGTTYYLGDTIKVTDTVRAVINDAEGSVLKIEPYKAYLQLISFLLQLINKDKQGLKGDCF